MAIVLASQSPRRQELLARIGVEDFKTLDVYKRQTAVHVLQRPV